MALKTISSRIGKRGYLSVLKKKCKPKNIQPRPEVAKQTAFVPVALNSEQPATEQPVGLSIDLPVVLRCAASNVNLAKTLIEALI